MGCEVAGHMASAVGKQREINAGAPMPFSLPTRFVVQDLNHTEVLSNLAWVCLQ